MDSFFCIIYRLFGAAFERIRQTKPDLSLPLKGFIK